MNFEDLSNLASEYVGASPERREEIRRIIQKNPDYYNNFFVPSLTEQINRVEEQREQNNFNNLVTSIQESGKQPIKPFTSEDQRNEQLQQRRLEKSKGEQNSNGNGYVSVADLNAETNGSGEKTVTTNTTGGNVDQRSWGIQLYDNLAKAKESTMDYLNNLETRRKNFYDIDNDLHKAGVFEGPIADDCHYNGYIKLDGYLCSLIGDVNYIGNLLGDYINQCKELEEETELEKQAVINAYESMLKVYSVIK